MKYSDILRKSIIESDLSLAQITRRLEKKGVNIDKSYLSKLQNGKINPAGERINDAISEVLGIDKLELKVAAYREKIPKDVLEKLIL
ncbi:XRE family transcriptional regulator [Lysinibacillus sp. FSL P4-0201]|uniref:XRE family transcriptional regulator n=1 Tax=Lysinibacillus sp. FSL P4-0201 TaxID=2921721 RepID=UPI00315B3CE5